MTRFFFTALALLLTICSMVYGQLTVNLTQTAQQLIQDEFVSGNSNVSNVTLVTGSNNPRSYGRFDRPPAGTPQEVFQRGIILSTGRAVDLPGPNFDDNALGNVSASTSLGTAGNNTLNLYSGQTTYDATVISFQFVPTSNVVRFRYIFASEEYTEYVNAGFNDVFAFLITGPGIVGEPGLPANTRNIARLPNNQPVSINTVNHLTNTSCFRNNVAGFLGLIPGPYNIEYDGFTCILTAESPVIPCSTYTLQLMIADAGDRIYDSAVLLEANSFEFAGDTSSVASLLNLFNGQPITYESCDNDIRFTIRRSTTVANSATQNDTIFFEHVGTATHLLDYYLEPPYAVFTPGQTEVIVNMFPIYDGVDEPDETVILRFVAPGTCGQIRELQAIIRNVNYNLQVNPPNDTTICAPPGTVTLNLLAGVVSGPPGVTYRWTNLANGQVLSTNPNYSLSVTQNVSIEVRVMANVCNVPDVRDTIHVTILTPDPNNPLIISIPDIPPICGGEPIVLSPVVSGGVGSSYTVTYYQNGNPIGNGVPFSFNPTTSGNLLIEAVDECGYSVSVFRPFVVEPGTMLASNDAVICSGQSTTLTAGVQNGALGSGYIYNWRVVGTNAFVGGGTSVTVSPSQTTTYYVSSPDFPCGNDTVTVTVIESTIIQPITAQTVCPGQSATFTANATGQGNIVYTWTPPAGAPFVGNPFTPTVGVSTTFTVTAQGDCGTAQTTAQLVVLPNDLSANPVLDPDGGTVCANTDVYLSVLASGGTPPYTYSWTGATGNGPNVTVNPTGPTTVSVNISDACTTIVRSVDLNAHPPLVVEEIADVTICQGQPVTLSANISGGSGNYVVQWRRVAGNVSVGNGNPVTFTPTQAGQYSLRVTDVDCGSQELRLFNVNFIPPFTLDLIANQTICAGQTATFNALASSTSGTVTYEWTQMPANTPVGSNSPTLNISPTATTAYRLRVTDDCATRTVDFTVNVLPDNLNFTLSANPGTSVCTGNSVTFSANVTGGTGNLSYLWTYGAQTGSGTTFTATITGAGQVSLALSDDCRTVTRTLDMTVEPPVSLVPPPATTICFGATTTLTANGSGGQPPLNYQWTGPNGFSNTGASVSVSPQDNATYTVTLTDACGTSLTETVVVTVRPDLNLTPIANQTICQGQSVDLTAVYSGGTPPVVMEWYRLPDATPFSNAASASLNPSVTTNYRLVVRDECFTRQSDFTITVVPSNLAAMPITVLPANTVCVGTTITLSTNTSGGSGNYVWTWSPPAPSSSTASFVVTEAGAYSVTVSDGCQTVTRSVNINVAPPLNLTASDDATICIGESTTLIANGSGGLPPLSYQWTGPDNFAQTASSVTVSPTATPSVYTVTLTDVCGTSLSETVAVNLFPDLTLVPQTNHTICEGETVDLTAEYFGGNPPVTVEWFQLPNTTVPVFSTTSVTLNPTTTTHYRLVVRDNCFTRQSDFTITVTPSNLALSPIIVQPATTVCLGTTVTLSANASGGSGIYNYTWTPSGPNSGTAQFVVTEPGTYSLVVDDGCNTRSRTVNINLAPDLTLVASGTATICLGASAELTASATGAFAVGTLPVWTDGNNNVVGSGNVSVSPSATTVYTAAISDSCGNTLTESVTVTVRPELLLGELEDRTICEGESTTYIAVASGAGTINYSWANAGGNVGSDSPNITLNPVVTTTYTLTVADDCSSRSETFTVNVHPATLAINNFTAPSAVCAGTTLTFSPTVSGGSGNYTYTWIPTATAVPTASFTINAPTTVVLTVSDGCQTVSETLSIDINTPITISAVSDTAICPVTGVATLNAVVQNAFGAQNPVQWFTQGGTAVGSGASVDVTPVATTTYYATVSDACGSAQSNPVTVTVLPTATLQPIDDVTICQGESVNLTAVASGTGTLQYRWSNVVTGAVASFTPNVSLAPSVTTDYQIQITDDCTALFDPFRINVVPANLTLAPLTAAATVCEGSTVTLAANVSGGSGNYTYTWTPTAPNSPSADFIVSVPTTISLTVSDGCMSVSESVFIDVNTPTQISAFGDVNICIGSSTTIGANVSGGLGGITGPVWTNAAGSVVGTGATISVSPQSSTYFVATATDECNVAARDTVWIVVFDSVGVGNLENRIICLGESTEYTAVVAGAGQVAWYQGNTLLGNNLTVSLSPTQTTTYRLEVSDSCFTLTRQFTVAIHPTGLAIASLSPATTVCQNSIVSLSVVATGGTESYTYSWSSGGNAATENVSIQGPGYISVTVFDGCTFVSDSVFIDVNTPTQISAFGDVNICIGSSTTIGANVSGGLGDITGPVWTNAAGSVVGTGATISVSPQSSTYFVATATDECNVAARDTVWIVVFDSVGVGNLPDTTICHGQSVEYTATVSGDGVVRWINTTTNTQVGSGLTATLSPTQTTTYRLEVEDSCFVLTRFFTITVHPPDLEISQNPPSAGPLVCSGTTVTLSVFALGGTGDYTFTWSDGQTGAEIQHVVPGDETIWVWVNDGCRTDSTAFSFVTDPAVYATAAGSINICEGSPTEISVVYSGGAPPLNAPVWTLADGSVVGTGDALTVSPVQTTRYYVTVSDVCGTTAVDSVVVTVFGPFGVADLDDRTICFGDETAYTAQIAGTGEVLWERESGGSYVFVSDQVSVTLSPSVTTNYRLTVSDSCFVVTRDFTVNVVPPTLTLTLTASVPSPVCSGTEVAFNAEVLGGSGNYVYAWSDGSDAAQTQAVIFGPHVVYVSVFDGCQTVSDTLHYDVTSPMVLTTSGDATICLGSSTTLQAFVTGGVGTLQYSWTTANTQIGTNASLTVSPPATTTYLITVTDECNAMVASELTVTVLSPFGLGTLEDRTICFGDSTTYTAPVSGAADVRWVRTSDNVVVGTNSSVSLSPPVSTAYELIVFDECFIDTVAFSVNVIPATLAIDSLVMNPPPPVCVGTPITLAVYVSGGSGVYEYHWSQDDSGTDVLYTTVTGAGSVVVRVSDGCQSVTAEQPFSDNPDLSIDAGPNLTICPGQTANLFVTFTGGFGNPDNFQWIDMATNATVSVGPVAPVSPSTSRSYRVILADDCGTSASDTVTVSLFEPLFVAPPMDTIICEGQCVEYTAQVDGTGTTTFEWMNFTTGQYVGTQGTVSLCPTVSTMYILTVRDTCGEVEYIFNVYVIPSNLSVEITAAPAAFVCINETVTLTATGAGGSGDYHYLWEDGAIGVTRAYTVTGPGTVEVRVFDGCTYSTNTIEFGVAPNVVANAGPDLGICPGATVTLHASASSGFGLYAYEWFAEGETTPFGFGADVPVTPSEDMRYVVRVVDECGTEDFDTTLVRILQALVIEPLPYETTICQGDSVTYTITSSGVGEVQYLWYVWGQDAPFATGQTITLSPEQSTHYAVVVSDSCAADSLDFIINVIRADLAWQIHVGPATNVCPGTEVTITATATGGSGNYTWTGVGQNGSMVTTVGTVAQTFSISVFDGCLTLDSTIVLTPFGPPTAYAGLDGFVCAGDELTLNGVGSGGSGNYGQVRWMNLAGEALFEGNPYSFVPTVGSSYVFAFEDSCGLEARDTVYIEVRPVPVVDAGTGQEVCQGTSVQLNASVIVGQFCEVFWTPTTGLNNPNILNPVALPNITTLYSLVAICNGCTSLVDTVRVKINPNPIVGTDADTVFYCLDGEGVELPGYVFSGTPPISVQWQPAVGLNDPTLIRPFASPETETTYTLSAIDSKGCVSNTVTVSVKHIPLPLADAGADREVCVGDPPFNLMGSGVGGDAVAYTYRWEPSTGLSNPNIRNPLVFPDSTRTYTLYVTSQPYGCRSQNIDETSTVTITVKRPPMANAGPDQYTCEGGTVQLSGSATGGNGIYEYRWIPALGLSDSSIAHPTASPPHTFTYMLQVISDGCVSSVDAVTVYIGGSPTVALPNVYEICPGESVDLNALVTGAQQPYTYTWEPPLYLSNPTGGSTVATPTENITYTLYVASNGCPGIQADSVQIVIRSGVFADADTTDRGLVICRGDTVRLPASVSGPSPLHWAWHPAPGLTHISEIRPLVAPESTTVYTLEVWRGPCREVDSVRVTVVEQTSISIHASADGLCEGQSVTLTARTDVVGMEPNLTWRRQGVEIGTGSSVEVNLPGVYSVTADWNGACFATDTVEVSFVANPSADFIHSFPGGCDALDVSFEDKSAGATAWIWNFGDGSPLSNERHPRHYYSAPGKYRVSLTTYGTYGCSATKTADVDVSVEAYIQPLIFSEPPPGTTLYLTDATVHFFDSTRHVMARNWYFGDGYHSPYANPFHRFLLPGTYTVKVTLMDSTGCTYERLLGPYTVLEPGLDIPNIFTPNGDGRNDFFRPIYDGVERFTYTVFDRWGNVVYRGDELSTGWNGIDLNGRSVAEGAYLYILKFDERRIYKGNVTLVR